VRKWEAGNGKVGTKDKKLGSCGCGKVMENNNRVKKRNWKAESGMISD